MQGNPPRGISVLPCRIKIVQRTRNFIQYLSLLLENNTSCLLLNRSIFIYNERNDVILIGRLVEVALLSRHSDVLFILRCRRACWTIVFIISEIK